MYFENGAVFEAVMLFCFGAAWPVGIIKTIKCKSVKGTTPFFYFLVFIGYLSGIIYKSFYNFDLVIFLYIFNAVTVGIQIILYFYYRNKELKIEPPQWL